MKTRFECLLLTLGVGVVLYPVSLARAQDVTIDLEDTKQMVQGFGGINHPVWAGDLTAAQRETAFGNGPGQLGFTVLRIFISENQNDWQREVATAQRAQELGLLIFASPWNPPSSMATTINGQKHVNPQMYGDYAAHLTAFYDFMQENGVDLYAVSVQNEPDYANEWTWWSADEIVTFLRDYGGDLPFRVMAPESFQYRKAMSDPILNDPAALQNMDILGAHLYGTQVRDFPYPLFKEKGAGKELWMTEVYYPNSDDNSADRWPEALGVAWHVHSAMVEAEFQAYVWWYIRRQYGPMKEDGTISKRGYSMAHFSKFVRRGFYRVEATKNPKNEVFVSAYKGDSDVVAVIVNRNTSSQSLSFSIPGTTITSYAKYTTSGSKNLSEEGAVEAANGTFTVTLDAESVTTLHGTGDVPSTGGTGGAPGSGGAAGSPGVPPVPRGAEVRRAMAAAAARSRPLGVPSPVAAALAASLPRPAAPRRAPAATRPAAPRRARAARVGFPPRRAALAERPGAPRPSEAAAAAAVGPSPPAAEPRALRPAAAPPAIRTGRPCWPRRTAMQGAAARPSGLPTESSRSARRSWGCSAC